MVTEQPPEFITDIHLPVSHRACQDQNERDEFVRLPPRVSSLATSTLNGKKHRRRYASRRQRSDAAGSRRLQHRAPNVQLAICMMPIAMRACEESDGEAATRGLIGKCVGRNWSVSHQRRTSERLTSCKRYSGRRSSCGGRCGPASSGLRVGRSYARRLAPVRHETGNGRAERRNLWAAPCRVALSSVLMRSRRD